MSDNIESPEPPKLTPVAARARGGLEPGRYGDWEIKGLTSDF